MGGKPRRPIDVMDDAVSDFHIWGCPFLGSRHNGRKFEIVYPCNCRDERRDAIRRGLRKAGS